MGTSVFLHLERPVSFACNLKIQRLRGNCLFRFLMMNDWILDDSTLWSMNEMTSPISHSSF